MEPLADQDTERLSRKVDQASRELKEAIIAVDHGRAERAASHYVEALQKLWDALPEDQRARSAIPARAGELLGWAREMAIIQRSLAADQLRVLERAARYYRAASSYSGLQVRS